MTDGEQAGAARVAGGPQLVEGLTARYAVSSPRTPLHGSVVVAERGRGLTAMSRKVG